MSDPANLLQQLRSSQVFASDFPRRNRLTIAEALESPRTYEEVHAPALEAIRRVSDPHALGSLARALGEARYEPAVPVLAELWRSCALQPLRTQVGHALREIATPEARAALLELIDDADHLSVFLGVRALFDSDPDTVFDRCQDYFSEESLATPTGASIACEILATFAPSSFSSDGPRWTESRAPRWLREDERWIRLCVTLRKSEVLGDVARDVLCHVPKEVRDPILEELRGEEGPSETAVRSEAIGDLLDRYLSGQHQEVWSEIRDLGAISGALREEVLAVARATMRRVAANADLVAERLERRGWRALSGSLRQRPPQGGSELEGLQEVIARVEELTGGQLPPTLLAFWLEVGGVDFVWDYQGSQPPELVPGVPLPIELLDPLCVDGGGSLDYQLEELEYLVEEIEDPELRGPFGLDLAPDHLHKANISGGAPYGVELPFAGADPVFANEGRDLPFLEYLRHAFQWGGFPGLEIARDQPGVQDLVDELSADLQSF